MFSVCVLMKGVPATVGLPAKNIFMRGLPDNYDINGGELNGQLYQFFGVNRVQALQDALKGDGTPFGWLGNQNPVPVNSSSRFQAITQNANGTVTFTLTNLALAFPVGSTFNAFNNFTVRISGIEDPGNINGTVTGNAGAGAGFFTTKKRIAIRPWDGVTGTLYYIPKMFVPFSNKTIQLPVEGNPLTYGNIWASRIGERKAGAIFGTVPGRRSNRVRA